jgi:hypothetical protein
MIHVSTAWQILTATFLALGRNWSAVLRAAFLPLILPLAALIAFGWWAYATGYALRYLPRHVGGNAELPVFAIAMILIAAVGTLAVAVTWHRFDLLGEAPRALDPRPGLSWTLGYLLRSLLILLVTFLTALIGMLPMILFIQQGPDGFNFSLGALPEPMTPRNFLLSTILWSVVTAYVLRWSLILPAGAIGRSLSLRQAREAAAARLAFPVFLCLGLFLHLAPIALDRMLAEIALGGVGSVLLLPFILLFWLMFGIALLTVLYGHCVQDRALRAPARMP